MFSENCVIWDHHIAFNYYFSNFFSKVKNEATGFKKSEEISTALFIWGWIQWYAGEGRRNVGSSMLLPASVFWAWRRCVPCWEAPERNRGEGVSASRHCPGAWPSGLLLWGLSWLPVLPCFTAQWLLGALWGASAEGSTSSTSAQGLGAPSAHITICNVYSLTSLLIYNEFKARKDL